MNRVSWERCGEWVDLLVAAIKFRHQTAAFADVIAISRGGLLPAVAIANHIPNLHLHVWDVRHKNVSLPQAFISHSTNPFRRPRVAGAGVVLVDDVVSSGAVSALAALRLIQYVDEIGPHFTAPRPVVTATLVASMRHQSRCTPDGDLVAIRWKGDNDEVRFPYEQP